MAFVNFIEFNTDKSTALSIRTSPTIKIHTFTGIQLLPNQTYPYRQTTNVTGGIELEDWSAYVVDACTNVETDVTDYFLVDDVFTNSSGDAQFNWSLTNVPYDFGTNLVYLKVIQSIGETFYSNLFQLTSYDSDKTCRIDYRDTDSDFMQSIQLHLYYWQNLKTTELGTYYETSTKNTVTTVVKSQKHERWITPFLSNDLLIKISDVFEYKQVYVNLIRCNLFEAIEVKELEAEGDFSENIIKLAFNHSDTYKPLSMYSSEVTNDDLDNSILLNVFSGRYSVSNVTSGSSNEDSVNTSPYPSPYVTVYSNYDIDTIAYSWSIIHNPTPSVIITNENTATPTLTITGNVNNGEQVNVSLLVELTITFTNGYVATKQANTIFSFIDED